MASTSAPPLKQLFSKFTFKIDSKLANEIIRWRLLYETRDTHPEALNTPLLGVNNIGFFPKDSNALFDITGINRDEFKKAIKQSSIPSNFNVASDEFNLLCTWVSHLFFNSKEISRDLKDKVIKSVYMMLMYKFFSGVVRHLFPYKPSRAIMEATIDNLSDKFDIKHKETSTWKLNIEKRADLMTETGSANIHFRTIQNYSPDSKVTYILTDLQTRIRTKIRLIAEIFYAAVENGNAVIETTLVGEDKEGEKTIKELQNSYDTMIESICNRVLNAQSFIKADYIKIICTLFANVRPEMVRNVLMQFSAMATLQYQKGKSDTMDKSGKLYEGYHILISNLIQRTYRACIVDKVKLVRANILKKAMNMYRSSRINDPTVLTIKDSVSKFIDNTKVSSRDATNASLKIGFIIYIILMSFDLD